MLRQVKVLGAPKIESLKHFSFHFSLFTSRRERSRMVLLILYLRHVH